jgi:NAD-dependent DNA ligase
MDMLTKVARVDRYSEHTRIAVLVPVKVDGVTITCVVCPDDVDEGDEVVVTREGGVIPSITLRSKSDDSLGTDAGTG